jgi:type II secretory pathway pseudopilin PulG
MPDFDGISTMCTKRTAMTLVELLVAVSLLTTVISLATGLSMRINRVWKEIGQARIALAELNNQLDTLLRLDPPNAAQAITALRLSDYCRRGLCNPTITGYIQESPVGMRITLEITWDRPHGGKPIQLSGWILEPQSEPIP